jgi:dTDP-4-dehydrorhamnose reductase
MLLVDNVKNEKDDTLKLPFDQYATPVNAEDIAKALFLLMTDNKSGVYNIASTDFVNRVQLAERVLGYFPNHKMKIETISTAELNPPAERPLNGGLLSAKFLKEYPNFKFTNVDDFMKQILG